MIECVKPDMILVQGMMVKGDGVGEIFSKVLGSWGMCNIDVKGRYRDLLAAWNPSQLNSLIFYAL